MTKVNISTSLCDISTSDFNNMVREADGQYSTVIPLSANDFIQCAKSLIAKKYQRQGVIATAQDSKNYFIAALATAENENFCVLYLDVRHQIIAFEILFRGTIDAAYVYPRVLIKKVLAYNAAAIIVAHNHPTGDTRPSSADIEITARLKQALGLIDVTLLDHIIVAGGKAESLSDKKML